MSIVKIILVAIPITFFVVLHFFEVGWFLLALIYPVLFFWMLLVIFANIMA